MTAAVVLSGVEARRRRRAEVARDKRDVVFTPTVVMDVTHDPTLSFTGARRSSKVTGALRAMSAFAFLPPAGDMVARWWRGACYKR